MTLFYEGDLAKMAVTDAEPVRYRLGEACELNDLIGERVTLEHSGVIHCRVCGKSLKKAYGEGYCFPHFRSDPANAPCVVRPELCEAHEGGGRDPAWEQRNHAQPHVVYLANSGGLKVGVTRATQMPTRWIDQGAAGAVVLAETPNRRLAGELEVALKVEVSDRTRWQRMLMGADDDAVDLAAERRRIVGAVPPALADLVAAEATPRRIVYPLGQAPMKVKSVNLTKTPSVTGIIAGLRGQYLIFEDGAVLNIRRHTGFEVSLRSA